MKVREQLASPADRLFRSTTALVLGKPKSGKTRWASTVGRLSFDEPCSLLIIDQDNGASAQKFSNPALIPESFKDYKTILDNIRAAMNSQDGPPYHMNFLGRDWYFSGLIVDTINRTQDIIRRDIKGGYLASKRLRIQDYGTLLDDVLGTILSLKELAETKPFHLIVTAQISPDKITIQDAKEEDPGHYYWQPSLIGSVAAKITEHFDNILTCHYEPQGNKYIVFGKDTVTPIGTFMGGLRFGEHCKPMNPSVVPSTWWEFLRLHQIKVSNPKSIGHLDIAKHVDMHWAEVEDNRQKMANTLAGKGVAIENLFLACGVVGWNEMSSYSGTGKEALQAALEYNNQEGQPTWYEFYNQIIPDIPSLLKGCSTNAEMSNVIRHLYKDKYQEAWDPGLATECQAYLVQLNSEAAVVEDKPIEMSPKDAFKWLVKLASEKADEGQAEALAHAVENLDPTDGADDDSPLWRESFDLLSSELIAFGLEIETPKMLSEGAE